MKQETVEILGVRVDNFSVGETKKKLARILESDPEQKFLTTLNPEILLKAHDDEHFRNILNGADLNLCDGFGIKLVSIFKGNYLKARFAGADLVDFLLETADQRKSKILVVAAKNGLSAPDEIEREIGQRYPNLSAKAEYFSAGQDSFENGIMEQAEIVFVNFGAPEQEKFIFENRAKFPNAKILVGVGGSFDFLTGKIRRAPKIFRVIGLEWLWRLIQEPKRFKRIWAAVVIFPAVAIFNKKNL